MRINIIILLIIFFAEISGIFCSESQAENWWLSLNDDELNTLISDALVNNPDIRSLQASLRLLKADIKSSSAAKSLQSTVAASSGYRSVESENDILNGNDSFHGVSLSASKSLDLFGRQRALIASAEILFKAGFDDVASFRLFLSGEVAFSWFRLKEALVRKKLKNKILTLHEKILSLLSERHERGLVTALVLLEKKLIVEKLKNEINSINETEAVEKTLLMTLCGIKEIPGVKTDRFYLPEKLEIKNNTDEMIRDHPDLLSITKKIDAGRETLKYYDKKYYPDFSLRSSVNFSSEEMSGLLDEWQADISLNISQLITDGGAVGSLKEKTYASLEKYNAQYKEAYLKIYKKLKDAIIKEKIKRENLRSLNQNAESLSLIYINRKIRFQNGDETMIALINAEISCLENNLSRESLIKQIIKERVSFYLSSVVN